MPRLQGYRERIWWKFYDTVDIAQYPQARWFGNANVGDRSRTNLVMGGQIHGDQTFVILSMYAVCPVDEIIRNYTMEFLIGNKTMVPTMSLREWLVGFRMRRPLIIPVRQNFQASGEWTSSEHFDNARAKKAPFDVAVHFEGLLTRDVA